jgi:hypothetical protein
MPRKNAAHAAAHRKRRPRPPWGKLLGGKPIERRVLIRDDKLDLDEESRERQYLKMQGLFHHYGIVGYVPLYPKGLADRSWWPWYELALAIASELDDSVKIVDGPRPGKTAARWRGHEGAQLIKLVEMMRKARPSWSVRRCLREVQQKIDPDSYGRMQLDQLVTRYHDAMTHHRTTKREC